MKTPDKAEIIVVIAHYNDAERLKSAITSIKEPIPVDILIIDDGSKFPPNEKELKEVYNGKGTLSVKYMPINQGVGKVRNLGNEIVKDLDYEFIGVMDSDDLNLPNRFYKQISFFRSNPDVYLLGSWCDCVDRDGNYLYSIKHSTEDKEIKKKMYLNSNFVHPTVVFRKIILETIPYYPEKYRKGGVEDYGFLFQVTRKFKVANYPESLILYTIHNSSISSKQRHWQVYNRLRVIIDNFYFGVYPIVGILRNLPLLFMPRGILVRIKKLV